MAESTGHRNLMADLKELLDEATRYEFDDFKNTTYATPKVTLYKKLIAMSDKVKQGRYDQ